MKKAYQPLLLVLFALGIVVVYSLVRGRNTPPELVSWRQDFEGARQEAASSGKPLLVYFTASWCGPCREMKRTTFADARVAQALEGVVAVKVDIDQSRELARRFGVDAVPRLQLMRAPEDPGRAYVGYISSEQLIQWLRGG